jgi:hypothetical protein
MITKFLTYPYAHGNALVMDIFLAMLEQDSYHGTWRWNTLSGFMSKNFDFLPRRAA